MNHAFSYSGTHFEASIEDIREYAYHLYCQSGFLGGRDVENWLEAIACLKANMSLYCPDTPLHCHLTAAADSTAFNFAGEGDREAVRAGPGESASFDGHAAKHISQEDFDQVKDDRRGEVEANRQEPAVGSQPELEYWHVVPGSKLDCSEH